MRGEKVSAATTQVLGWGAEFAGPENYGPQNNNSWILQDLEDDGP